MRKIIYYTIKRWQARLFFSHMCFHSTHFSKEALGVMVFTRGHSAMHLGNGWFIVLNQDTRNKFI